MVITDHFVDVNDNSWFTVSTPEYDISENILTQQMLSIDPTQIELYQYLSPTSVLHLPVSIATPPVTAYDIQDNIQCMIMDYFEVECDTGALELIETSLISYRKPSTTILRAMVSLLLRKRETIEQHQYKEYWIMADKTHDLLLKIVTIFGPRPFDSLWDTFDHSHLAEFKRQQQQLLYQDRSDATYTNDDGPMDTSDHVDSFTLDGLGAFKDFWDFVSQCLKCSDGNSPLQAKCYLHLLDILITVLEEDFRFKRDCSANVKRTTLLKTLQKNVVGGWDRFEHYLNILLVPFGSQQIPMIRIKQKEYAGRLLNLMIAISRYDISFSMTALADQTFRRSTQLDTDHFTNLLQYIEFDAFVLQVCDCGFVNANWSAVPQQYHYIKRERSTSVVENTSRWLEKWTHVYTKTRPNQIQWQTIYLHVTMIKQYYHSILKISSLRYDSDHQGTIVIRGCNDLDHDSLSTLLDDGIIKSWHQQVDTWMEQCRSVVASSSSSLSDYTDKQWERRIGRLLDELTF